MAEKKRKQKILDSFFLPDVTVRINQESGFFLSFFLYSLSITFKFNSLVGGHLESYLERSISPSLLPSLLLSANEIKNEKKNNEIFKNKLYFFLLLEEPGGWLYVEPVEQMKARPHAHLNQVNEQQ